MSRRAACWLLVASTEAGAAEYALLLNGGDRPHTNYQSHLHHLQDVRSALVDRGLPADHITVLSADGEGREPDMAVSTSTEADYRAWLLKGTAISDLVHRDRLVDSEWPGVTLLPATSDALQDYFLGAAQRLRPGDTLLVYVTDHGRKGSEGVEDATIALWHEEITVAGFRELLSVLHPDVHVMISMSQCYSGSFAAALYPVDGATPEENRCGWFSAPADRPAYGCYAEGRVEDIGHGFQWSEAIRNHAALDRAHDEVVLTDRTPDVPLSSSDVHIVRLLREEALRVGLHTDELVDLMLANILANPDPQTLGQLARVDALARSIQVEPPRSLAALERLQRPFGKLHEDLQRGRNAWETVLQDAKDRHLEDFLDRYPTWRGRLARAPRMSEGRRRRVVDAFLVDLDHFTITHPEAYDRLLELRAERDSTQAAVWRAAVREAVALRMETILRRVAGDALVRSDDPQFDDHRAALANLRRCEAAIPGRRAPAGEPVVAEPEPWPEFAADLAVAASSTPGWLGVEAGPVSASLRKRLSLPAGAMALNVVYDGSPAHRAGLLPGDVLVGPPDHPFLTESALLAWTLTQGRGVRGPMRLYRGEKTYVATLELEDWPSRYTEPEAPGPGDRVPPLILHDRDGELIPTEEQSYVLFFWATWCRPCKAAVPELLAWSEENGVPVVAVTDEPRRAVDLFERRWEKPFPALVAIDDERAAYRALVVSRTPTFVHVSPSGTILARQHGYSKVTGLFP